MDDSFESVSSESEKRSFDINPEDKQYKIAVRGFGLDEQNPLQKKVKYVLKAGVTLPYEADILGKLFILKKNFIMKDYFCSLLKNNSKTKFRIRSFSVIKAPT